MKKLIMMVIMMLSISLLGQENQEQTERELAEFESYYQYSDEFARKLEIAHNDNYVDAIVEAEVISIQTIVTKIDNNLDTLRNLIVFQKVRYKVLQAYKSKTPIDEYIDIFIPGGRFTYNGKEYEKFSPEDPHALLDVGDTMLLALRKLENGYEIYGGKEFQIPSKENIITSIENQKKEKAKLKALSTESNDLEFMDVTSEKSLILEDLTSKNVKKELIKINNIKQYLQDNFQQTRIRR